MRSARHCARFWGYTVMENTDSPWPPQTSELPGKQAINLCHPITVTIRELASVLNTSNILFYVIFTIL